MRMLTERDRTCLEVFYHNISFIKTQNVNKRIRTTVKEKKKRGFFFHVKQAFTGIWQEVVPFIVNGQVVIYVFSDFYKQTELQSFINVASFTVYMFVYVFKDCLSISLASYSYQYHMSLIWKNPSRPYCLLGS